MSGRLPIGAGSIEGVTNFDTPVLLHARVVTGEPYSGTRVSEHSQTLADGTHIQQKREISREYRDSEGRTRSERKLFNGPRVPVEARQETPRLVQIFDPVAGYSYTLDTQKLIAYRVVLPSLGDLPKQGRPSNWTVVPGTIGKVGIRSPLRHKVKQESLGTEMIDGVLAAGKRLTVTTPTGEEGNDRPLIRTCEHWQSEEMVVILYSKCSDPRTGETIIRFDHMDRMEPDPELFQVPPEYTVVDDHGPFAVESRAP